MLPSLEVAGPGMHWVEVSRAVRAAGAEPSDDTKRMLEAYTEYYEAARSVIHAGASCHDVHMAVSRGFHERGYRLGHVTGHSIGMTMIEFPKVGEGVEIELQENMVLSMHPHAIAENGEDCLYMQDTWLVTPSGGVPLADLPMEIWVRGALADASPTWDSPSPVVAGYTGSRELAVDRAARDRHRHRRRRGVAKVRASRRRGRPACA